MVADPRLSRADQGVLARYGLNPRRPGHGAPLPDTLHRYTGSGIPHTGVALQRKLPGVTYVRRAQGTPVRESGLPRRPPPRAVPRNDACARW
jgi:hypothetical protein